MENENIASNTDFQIRPLTIADDIISIKRYNGMPFIDEIMTYSIFQLIRFQRDIYRWMRSVYKTSKLFTTSLNNNEIFI